MPFPFYNNSLDNSMTELPSEFYKGLQQAFYNEQWDNTSAITEIQMETEKGSGEYEPVEVWINKAIGNTTTFMKNGQDFRQLLFKDIEQKCGRGYMFLFEDNYWLGDFWNPSQGLAADILIRRCNNFLKIIDPESGNIFSIPCVVDYDMTSPTALINNYILTPNSHAIVYVQANKNTLRLFTLNKRFLLNGRPFKLYAYQNTLNRSIIEEQPSVLYLDLYLDELHAKDDIENNIADNGVYNYTVVVENPNLEVKSGATGNLKATVLLNGQEIDKAVIWSSSNEEIIQISSKGVYSVVGKEGESCFVEGRLDENGPSNITVIFNIVQQTVLDYFLVLNPLFSKIRQYETINTEIQVKHGEQILKPDIVQFNIDKATLPYLNVTVKDNILSIQCIRSSPELKQISIKAIGNNPFFSCTKELQLQCVSLLG